jgi:hypothetical protein
MNQSAFTRLPWYDDHATFTAPQKAAAAIESEPGFRDFGTVAVLTLGRQQRPDFGLEELLSVARGRLSASRSRQPTEKDGDGWKYWTNISATNSHQFFQLVKENQLISGSACGVFIRNPTVADPTLKE